MNPYDPSRAPRSRDSGYKGDAWIVSLTPDEPGPTLLLDTGLDSVGILSIPDSSWDRAIDHPGPVHAHDGYDETILVTRGSGHLLNGPDPQHIVATRFGGPSVFVVPAGVWHHTVMDADVSAHAFCFFTRPGTVIAPFADQMAAVTKARVSYPDLAVVRPEPVHGAPLPDAAGDAPGDARLVDALPESAGPGVRILPFEPPAEGELSMPLDTGVDSLFIMATPPPSSDDGSYVPQPLDPPDEVDIHSHPDVDEYIILAGAKGELLNGPTPEAVTRTPFQGPCVLVMPAGGLHRVVMAEEHSRRLAPVLVYADRRAVVEPFARITARTTVASFGPASGPEDHS